MEKEDLHAQDVRQFSTGAFVVLRVHVVLHLAQVTGCSMNAAEKDWICGVFTRPSLDSSAYHTASTCSDDELFRTFFDDQEDCRLRICLCSLRAHHSEGMDGTCAEMHVGMQ